MLSRMSQVIAHACMKAIIGRTVITEKERSEFEVFRMSQVIAHACMKAIIGRTVITEKERSGFE